MSKYTLLSLLFVALAFNIARHKNPEIIAQGEPSEGTLLEGVVVKIIDGDSFRVDDVEVRLWGVDAPEYRFKGFEAAREGLRSRIAGRFIQCTVLDQDRYERQVARCQFDAGDEGKKDLGLSLLQAGLVREYCHYSRNYYGYCEQQPTTGENQE